MDDYGLVLNAGSSSLKFCVYRRPTAEGWQLEARGQIDGIGTAPRLTAKNDAGASLVDEALSSSVKDGGAAIDSLAEWLRTRYAGSSSLKFCVYHRPAHERWALEARGQIDGIGSSPRLTAKTEGGETLADDALDASVKDGRAAVELLAELAPRARLVVSSDLPRARETALIVAGGLGLPLRWDPGLREQDLGALEGRTLDRGGQEDAVSPHDW